jgi:hypothetical protein
MKDVRTVCHLVVELLIFRPQFHQTTLDLNTKNLLIPSLILLLVCSYNWRPLFIIGDRFYQRRRRPSLPDIQPDALIAVKAF